MNRHNLLRVLAAAVALAAPFLVHAQTNVSEDFTGTTTTNSWYYFNGACLTASTLAGSEPSGGTGGQIPGCTTIATSYYNKSSGETLVGGQQLTNSVPDNVGSGALRFTNGYPYGYHENGGIVYATPFSTGQGVSITFKTVTYRGDQGGGGKDGADGISFYLMDATQLNTSTITGVGSGDGNGLGAWGGSLGYTCSNSNPPFNGLVGGYLGLGIDEYGNFLNGSSNTLGESGTTAGGDNTASGGGYQWNRIGLRGAGNVAWNTLTGAYGTNPNNSSKPYYPASLATGCSINGGTYQSSSGYCVTSSGGQNPTDAMQAVQNTCSNGTLYNYSNTGNPHSAGSTALTNTYNTGNSSATPAIAPILDYTALPSGYVVLPTGTQIANESAMTRSAATPIFYQLTITQNGLLSLSYSTCPPSSSGGCSAFQSVLTRQNITTSNGPLPANFLFGFAGSTGGSSNIHEILCFKAVPSTSAASSAGASEKQSAKLETGTQAFFAFYNPNNGWTGRVTATNLTFDSYGNVVLATNANWDASCVLSGVYSTQTCPGTGVSGPMAAQTPTSRTILSWNGTTGIPFEWANLTTAQQSALTSGDSTSSSCNSSTSYANYDRLNYLRGDRSCEINSASVGLFRRRTNVLADIVDSSPVWVGAPVAPYSSTWGDRTNASDPLPENGGSAQTYSAYVTAQQTRLNVVYVGSDDGLLHGFESGSFDVNNNFISTYNDGKEVLAYMPSSVVNSTAAQNIHSSTANVDYSNSNYGHDFYVDATPGSGDVFYNNAWHSWIVGGLGPGGNAIYALDVTNPTNFSEGNASSLVIGEWNSSTISCTNVTSCGTNMGNTYGTPQMRRLHDGKWAFIFGNGLASSSGDAGIYIGVLNTSSGVPTFYYLSTHTGSTSSPNGIAFVTPVDLDGDHITDYVYAGDLQGNVWRFDLTSGTESNWAVSTGPLFSTPGGQPITTAVVVASGSPNAGMQQQLMVLFGTGQKFPLTNTTPATYSSGTQSMYGVWDWNLTAWNTLQPAATYAAMTPTQAGLTTAPYTLHQSNLAYQTVTINTTTQDREIATNATICWKGSTGCTGSNGQFGWYLNFPGTQEQVVFSPELVQQAITVNSLVPATNTPTSCTVLADTGFTYVISAMTGGAFNEVFLPPDEQGNSNVNNNPIYTDPVAAAIQTNATGSSFVILNASGTPYLVYQTNQSSPGGSGSSGGGSGGTGPNGNGNSSGTQGLNLSSNNTGRRLSWIERR
jgi:type IV pilus assembly protein PilY1